MTGPYKKEGHLPSLTGAVSVAFGKTLIGAQVALQKNALNRFKKAFDSWQGDQSQKPASLDAFVSELIACAAHQVANETDVCPLSPVVTDQASQAELAKLRKNWVAWLCGRRTVRFYLTGFIEVIRRGLWHISSEKLGPTNRVYILTKELDCMPRQ